MKRIIIFLIIWFSLPGFIFAESADYTISGKITNIDKAPIYIFLTDKETTKVPFAGIKKIIITPDEKAFESGSLEFVFENIPQGVYGIRCFQDMNGNAKLDKGLFGSKEPWGLSWNKNKTSGWPSFDNFCFSLNEDINDLIITLKK